MGVPETIQEELEGEDRSQTTSYKPELRSYRQSASQNEGSAQHFPKSSTDFDAKSGRNSSSRNIGIAHTPPENAVHRKLVSMTAPDESNTHQKMGSFTDHMLQQTDNC